MLGIWTHFPLYRRIAYSWKTLGKIKSSKLDGISWYNKESGVDEKKYNLGIPILKI